jgi:hypothetical protein
MDLRKLECDDVNRIELALGRGKLWAFVNMVINLPAF